MLLNPGLIENNNVHGASRRSKRSLPPIRSRKQNKMPELRDRSIRSIGDVRGSKGFRGQFLELDVEQDKHPDTTP